MYPVEGRSVSGTPTTRPESLPANFMIQATSMPKPDIEGLADSGLRQGPRFFRTRQSGCESQNRFLQFPPPKPFGSGIPFSAAKCSIRAAVSCSHPIPTFSRPASRSSVGTSMKNTRAQRYFLIQSRKPSGPGTNGGQFAEQPKFGQRCGSLHIFAKSSSIRMAFASITSAPFAPCAIAKSTILRSNSL